MNVSALSNSLFVNNVAVVTQQYEIKPSRPYKSQENSIAGQVDASRTPEVDTAEQNQATNSEPIEIKRTLDEHSEPQTDIQKNEKDTNKSDNSTANDTANYVSALADAVSTDVEGLEQQTLGLFTEQVDSSQVSTMQKALANQAYLENSELTANLGSTAETLSNTLGEISGDEGMLDITIVTNGMAGQKEAQVADELQILSSEGETTMVSEVIKSAEVDSHSENGQQINPQTIELDISEEVENNKSQGNATEVFSSQVITDVKATQTGNISINDANTENITTEKITEEVAGQIGSSTDKEALKNEDWTLLSQDNSESRTFEVINTDTGSMVEKEAEVSETLQPNQPGFDKEVFDKVGEQLQESISNSVRQGDSEITVRLNPPELGRVVVRFQQQDGQVTGSLEFNKAETRAEVQQLLPQLVRNLQDSGIAVRKLDVVQTQIDNSGQQQFREHIAGDGYQQQYDQGQSDSYGLGYDWMSTEPVYSGVESLSESVIDDQAVNVLV